MFAVIDGGVSVADIEVIVGLIMVGFLGWRWKRGDFYKAVATEKTAEADKLREENERLHDLTDITPILKTLDGITRALNRHTDALDATLGKVADMNGSLRAHSEAMKALADRLILDEAARGLLAEASKPNPARRRTS